MRPSSQRRPKSAAAAAAEVRRRVRSTDPRPWDSSIRTNGGGAGRRRAAAVNTPSQGTPVRLSYSTAVATPAAALVANVPPTNEPQVELMSQLQDVVVRLSRCAVGEKQRLAHMQQRLDAYAALVREQDRMIDELRGMNIRLQKEKDALISFRQQSLNHDLQLMNHLENDGGIDEEVRRTYAKFEGRQSSYEACCNGSLRAMTPRSRGFVRSLVAQLRDERRKRLEVEEQSSRMIGEQQVTIQRLEDRLRPQAVAPRSSLAARMESPQASSHKKTSNGGDASNTPVQFDCTDATGGPVSSTTLRVVNQEGVASEVRSTVPVVPPIPLPGRSREIVVIASDPLPDAESKQEEVAPAVEFPLAIHGTSYEDAAAILSDIRRRHGL
ncbi:uncharacterized protein Tco025E_07547 [Trypanosoma conorhini]|uniref:Uncharacterized protein n=1 Tax=Trypanosoma conorhini TaxID=83891 RepID=A0A422NLY4_9TRYP|nr:uncharacterized protein Tco025E_07547 [Trypanosoma conorhini]RNF06491.1 hypothetical protein Tco025E_07547 [Trypanosoma conorhini]